MSLQILGFCSKGDHDRGIVAPGGLTDDITRSASGGLVTLASKVGLGDTVFVVNGATQEEQECRVANVGTELEGRIRVGVAL